MQANQYKNFIMYFMIALIFFVHAILVVYLRDLNRYKFSQLKSLQMNRDLLYQQRSQLLVEQSMLASYSRIDNISKNKLAMHLPNKNQLVLLSTFK